MRPLLGVGPARLRLSYIVALATSCCLQVVAHRLRGSPRRDQAIGLGLLSARLVAVVLAAPIRSIGLLAAGAGAAGAGHGLAFLNAQHELNELTPRDRRGEVSSAFVACIYFVVASSVIATGLLDLRFSLTVSVGVVAAALMMLALGLAAWQLVDASPERGSAPTHRAAARRYGVAPR
jgi:hypothetical protein